MSAPLRRDAVTRSVRIMLPTYPLVAGLLGLNYICTPEEILLQTPVFVTAAEILPMPVWGALFVSISIGLTWALFAEHRRGYQMALNTLMVAWGMWVLVFAWSVFEHQASPGSPLWPLLACIATYATNTSLEAEEARS